MRTYFLEDTATNKSLLKIDKKNFFSKYENCDLIIVEKNEDNSEKLEKSKNLKEIIKKLKKEDMEYLISDLDKISDLNLKVVKKCNKISFLNKNNDLIEKIEFDKEKKEIRTLFFTKEFEEIPRIKKIQNGFIDNANNSNIYINFKKNKKNNIILENFEFKINFLNNRKEEFYKKFFDFLKKIEFLDEKDFFEIKNDIVTFCIDGKKIIKNESFELKILEDEKGITFQNLKFHTNDTKNVLFEISELEKILKKENLFLPQKFNLDIEEIVETTNVAKNFEIVLNNDLKESSSLIIVNQFNEEKESLIVKDFEKFIVPINQEILLNIPEIIQKNKTSYKKNEIKKYLENFKKNMEFYKNTFFYELILDSIENKKNKLLENLVEKKENTEIKETKENKIEEKNVSVKISKTTKRNFSTIQEKFNQNTVINYKSNISNENSSNIQEKEIFHSNNETETLKNNDINLNFIPNNEIEEKELYILKAIIKKSFERNEFSDKSTKYVNEKITKKEYKDFYEKIKTIITNGLNFNLLNKKEKKFYEEIKKFELDKTQILEVVEEHKKMLNL